ncbi:Gldg family protein [Egbenema bharatensis]|uniref:Gldg family protein n=1 Tax=Egbenema bharatensis TaxID=3463334 RepID=UPI003A857B3F
MLEAEINALRSHLQQRGGVLLLIDPQTEPNNPQVDFGLNPLLEEWGVRLNDRIVIDPAGEASGLGLGVTIVNQYGDHPITRGFGNGISFFPLARPLETAEIPEVEAVQLLVTSDRTEAHRLGESGELEFDPETDPRGPFNLGLALSRDLPNETADGATNEADEADEADEAGEALEEPEGTEELEDLAGNPQARLVVIGNASFAGNRLFEQQLNGDVFLNSVSWLSQNDDEVLSIRPREMTNRRILMTPIQQLSAALLAIAVLPLAGILAAAFVWWRRR